MTEVTKTLFGGCFDNSYLEIKDIPAICDSETARTIVWREPYLYIWKDTRPSAVAWVVKFLPNVLHKQGWDADKYRNWYENLPQNVFLEFTATDNRFYWCEISPK